MFALASMLLGSVVLWSPLPATKSVVPGGQLFRDVVDAAWIDSRLILPADSGVTSETFAHDTLIQRQDQHAEQDDAETDGTSVGDDQPQADPEIVAMLDRLEKSHASLTGLTASVLYSKVDPVLQRTETRTGTLIYKIDGPETDAADVSDAQPAAKRFAVLFDSKIVGRRRTSNLKHFVFDGRWLADINHEDRQFIKREVVPPGKTFDPLKLGEGPFPFPIGQSRQDVLTRFSATAIDLPTEGPLSKLENVRGLKLVPRPGTPEARGIKQVLVFYDQATDLPVGVELIEPDGGRKTIRLSSVERDPQWSDDLLAKLSIAEPDPTQWDIDIQAWAGASGDH